eukprot:TRINITY_DN3498_c0_g1_i3.p1 TRINITY_DN3498_c0_g1~~TRINITY_DN3498_c0_g1_i3.p1  ORF type:complete len:189 (+),score=12.97 TRINITY_DN3498_c0_g1_i3:54-620(+)
MVPGLAVLEKYVDLLSNDKIDPDVVVSHLRDVWSTLGVVGALLLTMSTFSKTAGCDVDGDWFDCTSDGHVINVVHVILSWTSTAGCCLSVCFSTLLYVFVGLVSGDRVEGFLRKFHRVIDMPIYAVIVGFAFYVLDLLWTAHFTHGFYVVLPLSCISVLLVIYMLYLYCAMAAYTTYKGIQEERSKGP